MDAIHRIEVEWIAAFQNVGGLTHLMIGLSYLGSEALFCLVPLIYFAVSREAGLRLFMLFQLAGCAVGLGKMFCQLPRPYWIEPRVKELGSWGGFGMPSGHALDATVVWAFAARVVGSRGAWLAALAVILLVAISRVYLGVHFISDVVVGITAGALLYLGFTRLEPAITPWLASRGMRSQLLLAVAVTLIIGGLAWGIEWSAKGAVDPPTWAKLGAKARASVGMGRKLGEFLGGTVAIILAARWARFKPSWEPAQGGVAWLSAVLGAWVLYKSQRFLPETMPRDVRLLFQFFVGLTTSGWMVLGVPWLMLRYGWLEREANPEERPVRV